MDSSAKILAKRYARAFMGLDGKAHGSVTAAVSREKLNGLRAIFEAVKPHLKVLTHPVINAGVKLDVLDRILGARNTGPAAAFAALLVRQNRFGLLGEIIRECLRLDHDFCGIVPAEIRSRFPLSAGEVERIEKLLVSVTGKKINLQQAVSESVIGGFEIKIGDMLIDATVRGRLDELKAGLLGR